jgi:hypothetical protein
MKRHFSLALVLASLLSACATARFEFGQQVPVQERISVKTALSEAARLDGRVVAVDGFLCWSENYEWMWVLASDAEVCEDERYLEAIKINLVSGEKFVYELNYPRRLQAKSGAFPATVTGTIRYCEGCVSTDQPPFEVRSGAQSIQQLARGESDLLLR